jgi:outer membrane protein W
MVPLGRIDPWIGLGFGYEWLTANGNFASSETSASATLRGWEFVNLQGGVDWAVSDDVAIGPFVSVSFAEYTNISTDCSGGACGSGVSESLSDKALHNWVVVGLRGTFLCGARGRGAPCSAR